MARKGVFGKLCERTVVNGVWDWYHAKKIPAKVVWSILLLGALAAVVFYSYQMVSSYLQFQTVTQISEVRVLQMPFPNVTICHSGRFNKTFIQESIALPPTVPLPPGYDSDTVKLEFIRYFAALAYQTVQFAANVAQYLQEVYEYNFNATVNKNASDILTFLNQSAYQCEKAFTYCVFAGKPFPCCSVVRLVLSDYGFCYHMQLRNRDPSELGQAMQLVPGYSGGLTAVVSVEKSQISRVNPNDDAGVRVHLSSYLEPNDYRAVLLLPDAEAMIRLNPTKRISDPAFVPCLTNPKPLPYHETYTKGLCENECVYNFSMQVCSCAPAGYSAQVPTSLVCSPQKMLDCQLPKLRNARSDLKSVVSQCYKNQCPKYCTNWDFAPSVTYQGMHYAGRFDGSKSLADAAALEHPTTQVTFFMYFGAMQYMKIEQQPLMTFEEFICNLGGMCGLWTGVSVVGIIQCCYIISCGRWEPDEDNAKEDAKKREEATRPPIATVQGSHSSSTRD